MIFAIDFLASGIRDDSGAALSLGSVTFYEAGTTAKATVYSDISLSTVISNPATLDSAGRVLAFSNSRVRVVIADSNGVIRQTIDNIGVGAGDVETTDIAGGAVSSAALSNSVITNSKVASGAIQSSHLSASAVTTAKLASAAVTADKISSLNYAISNSSNTFSTTNTSYTAVTNLSTSFTSTGRPIWIGLVSDASGNPSFVSAAFVSADAKGQLALYKDGSIYLNPMPFGSAHTSDERKIPSSYFFWYVPSLAAGTYTFSIYVQSLVASQTMKVYYAKLIAFEAPW